MEEKDNLHSGHRERVLNKFMNNSDSLIEHELLEALLFYAIPRKDTNPIAHKLIRQFGSFEKVFKASADELKTVDGVGDKAACLISLVGKSAEIIQKGKDSSRKIFNLSEAEQDFLECFSGQKYEICAILLIGKTGERLVRLEFTSDGVHRVEMNMTKVARALAHYRPAYAILAHSHPDGESQPSYEDDLATKQFKYACDLHNVVFCDHLIYTKEQFFSYRSSGRMDLINIDSNVNDLLSREIKRS